MKSKPITISDVQPNPGWGDLCATCKHTFPNDLKYETPFPADFPCKKIRWSRGIMILPDLTRYRGGSETCSDFEKAMT